MGAESVPHMHTFLKWLIHMRAVLVAPVATFGNGSYGYPGIDLGRLIYEVNSHVSSDHPYALIPIFCDFRLGYRYL